MPMPRPPTSRQNARSHTENASPAPIELAKNRTAPMSMTRVRPHRSAQRPAYQAPAAQPSSAIATTKPVTKDESSNSPSTASTAPLMTELSKPNRNPPTAAATDSMMTLPWCSASRG
jgi:hypothetical protein